MPKDGIGLRTIINAPLYWHKIDDDWHNYTLNGTGEA